MENKNTTIEVLPQSVIEKIAAGEIIERPTAVLKELIENAVDAQATKIEITVEDSGFASLIVADNGNGMDQRNLQKSVLRHATSKIRSLEELYTIKSMGFRGEALASIGAVSHMTIASSASHEGLGYSITCDGTQVGDASPVSHLRGTTVTVRDIFYNVPARKKFLKSRKSERIALLKRIENISFAFPEIHFSAVFEGSKVLELTACDSTEQRIAQVAGAQFAKQLIHCSGKKDGMDAVLFISPPEDGRPKPRFQELFVNLRSVESDQVLYAVREAFKQFMQAEFRPSFFCFLQIDPSRIDVNVHPAKLKVKFEDERSLFGFIFEIARRGIFSTRVKPGELVSPESMNGNIDHGIAPDYAAREISDFRLAVEEDTIDEKKKLPPGTDGSQVVLSFPATPVTEKKGLDSDTESTVQLSNGEHEESWNLISCYQIHNMFILAPIKNGIVLIDQHAAHERIIFEQALLNLTGSPPESQQLLFPIVVELSPAEKAVVQSGKDLFNALGFDIGDFGGNTVSISALPALVKDSQAEQTVRETIRFLLDDRRDIHISDSQKRFAAAFACGAAIKAGQRLSQEEMNALLNSLFGSKNPYTCPHGRPTLFRMSLDEISRRFLR